MKKNKQMVCLIGVVAVGIATMAGCSGERRNPFSANPVETGAYLDMTPIDSGAAGYMTRNGMMNGVIQLSDTQKTRIDSLYRYYRHLVRHEWKEEGVLYDSLQVAVMNVLTTDQKNLLDSVEAQLEAGIIPDTLVAARLADLTALLSLTANQDSLALPILKSDMQAQLDTLIADSAEIRQMIAQHRHHRWLLKGDKFGLPDAFWNLLTDSQKRILFREERFMRRR
jgi:hypothetical protein